MRDKPFPYFESIKLMVLFALLLLASCAKPLPADKLDYVGDWRSKEMRLVILQDGTVSYRRLVGGGSKSINGPLKEFTESGFTVGIGFLSSEFFVLEAPNESDGRWQMVVDGVRLVRVSE